MTQDETVTICANIQKIMMTTNTLQCLITECQPKQLYKVITAHQRLSVW
jgi:hypothetical protein